MKIDVLHAFIYLASLVCICIAIMLAVLRRLVIRDGGEGGLAGCLGTCLTAVMFGLGTVFLFVGLLA